MRDRLRWKPGRYGWSEDDNQILGPDGEELEVGDLIDRLNASLESDKVRKWRATRAANEAKRLALAD